jgi:ribose transport system substrate-binding protein
MRKFLFALVSVLAILGLLAACTPVPSAAPTAVPAATAVPTNLALQKGKPFVFLSPNRQHPVVRTMKLGYEDACAFYGIKCIDDSFDGVDMSNMTTQADLMIAQGASGAIIYVDQAVYAADNKIIAAGIPSDCIHVEVPQGAVPGLLAWAAPDIAGYAVNAADIMGQKMGGKGVVALTQGSLNDTENLVTKAYTAEMAAKFPGITVLPPQMEGFDQTAAIAVAETILKAHPEITAAFGTTGNSPVTWAKAAQAAGLKPGQILIVGMDYTRQNLDLVKDGEVFGLVGQPLYDETYAAVTLLVEHMQGKTVPYQNLEPATFITQANEAKFYTYADRVDAATKAGN